MSCEKDWIDISTALLTPVIAVGASVIAYLQWKLNRSRFRHEVFEKKYRIFEATQLYLSQIVSKAKMIDDERYTFLRDTKGAFVLYDQAIVDYLNEVHRRSININLFQNKSLYGEETEELKWFGQQILEIDSVFKEHLKIE